MRAILSFCVVFLLALPIARAGDGLPDGYRRASESVLNSVVGRWALKDASNCGVPSNTYTLSLAVGKIVWVSDVGNTDIEAVIGSSELEFRTITITSTRVSGRSEPTGMNWTYARISPLYMKVTRGGRDVFLLARCFE